MKIAPIALFCYNRPDLLRGTLQSLKANELAQESELFIFCDGPKENASSADLDNIRKVRAVAREQRWCGKVNVIEQEKNKGLAASIIGGVTDILSKYENIIIVEDDVALSPYFLDFMNKSLEHYKNEEKIIAVGSWNYFCAPEKLDEDYFFFRYPDSIAWATFARAWKLFEQDAVKLLHDLESKNRMEAFNGDGEALYFENMLKMQIKGQINSWAIRWTGASVLHDKLCVFPKETLSKHMGFGDDATHEKTDDYNSHLTLCKRPLSVNYSDPKENKLALEEWKTFIRANFIKEDTSRPGLGKKIKAGLRRIKNIFHA